MKDRTGECCCWHVKEEAQPFDPVPWFCGALLVAYFVVEYIGGGIGL